MSRQPLNLIQEFDILDVGGSKTALHDVDFSHNGFLTLSFYAPVLGTFYQVGRELKPRTGAAALAMHSYFGFKPLLYSPVVDVYEGPCLRLPVVAISTARHIPIQWVRQYSRDAAWAGPGSVVIDWTFAGTHISGRRVFTVDKMERMLGAAVAARQLRRNATAVSKAAALRAGMKAEIRAFYPGLDITFRASPAPVAKL